MPVIPTNVLVTPFSEINKRSRGFPSYRINIIPKQPVRNNGTPNNYFVFTRNPTSTNPLVGRWRNKKQKINVNNSKRRKGGAVKFITVKENTTTGCYTAKNKPNALPSTTLSHVLPGYTNLPGSSASANSQAPSSSQVQSVSKNSGKQAASQMGSIGNSKIVQQLQATSSSSSSNTSTPTTYSKSAAENAVMAETAQPVQQGSTVVSSSPAVAATAATSNTSVQSSAATTSSSLKSMRNTLTELSQQYYDVSQKHTMASDGKQKNLYKDSKNTIEGQIKSVKALLEREQKRQKNAHTRAQLQRDATAKQTPPPLPPRPVQPSAAASASIAATSKQARARRPLPQLPTSASSMAASTNQTSSLQPSATSSASMAAPAQQTSPQQPSAASSASLESMQQEVDRLTTEKDRMQTLVNTPNTSNQLMSVYKRSLNDIDGKLKIATAALSEAKPKGGRRTKRRASKHSTKRRIKRSTKRRVKSRSKRSNKCNRKRGGSYRKKTHVTRRTRR